MQSPTPLFILIIFHKPRHYLILFGRIGIPVIID